VNAAAATSDYLRWLVIEKGRSPATITAYRGDLDEFMTWLESHGLSLELLTPADMERYVAEDRASGRATSSVNRRLAAVRGLFRYLHDEGTLDSDPSSRVSAGRRARPLPKPLSEDLMVHLLDSISGSEPRELRDRALLELLYGTGVRVSEAVGIQLQHLDFDEELILVTGKGSKQRLVPMGRSLKTALRRYLEAPGRAQLVTATSKSALFLNQRGRVLSRQGVDLIIHQRALAAGVSRTGLSAHVFRHSCATHMLEHGADIRVVQELLGHASISTTQLYTAVSLRSLRAAYADAHPRAHDLS
jgi:site-specific recombinase XerD